MNCDWQTRQSLIFSHLYDFRHVCSGNKTETDRSKQGSCIALNIYMTHLLTHHFCEMRLKLKRDLNAAVRNWKLKFKYMTSYFLFFLFLNMSNLYLRAFRQFFSAADKQGSDQSGLQLTDLTHTVVLGGHINSQNVTLDINIKDQLQDFLFVSARQHFLPSLNISCGMKINIR